jgi:hypothetical protein
MRVESDLARMLRKLLVVGEGVEVVSNSGVV